MGILDSVGKSIVDAKNFLANPFERNPKSSLRGDDFAKGFQITELDPPRESINLVKHLMPIVPFEFGGTQRIVKEFYPGNSEPVYHILGSEEDDLVVNGRLWEKKFNESNLPGGAHGIALNIQEQLDEFRIRGSLLRIQLGEFIRFGFLKDTKFPMKHIGDIGYQLTFDISGFNPPLRSQFAGQPRQVPSASNKELTELLNNFNENFSVIPDSVPASVGDILNDAIGLVADAVNVVTSFIDTVLNVAEDVNDSLSRAIGLVRFAQTTMLQYKRRIGLIKFNFDQSTSLFNGVSPSARYVSFSFILGSMTAVNNFANLLERMRVQLEDLRTTIPFARHLVKEGDTLQNLALRFYDDDQEWKRIFDHNNLTDTELVSSTVLEIPQL